MIRLRFSPHRFHALKLHLLPTMIKDVHRRILEWRRRLRDTMHRPHAIVFKSERIARLLGRLEEDGVGRVYRDVLVKVVERCQEEAVESDW